MGLFSGSVRSTSLNGNTWIQVSFPDQVRRDDRPLKVVYALHGTTGHSADWIRFTRLPLYAVEHEVFFVVPEIGNAWGRDIRAGEQYFSYLSEELPGIVASIFGLASGRDNTAIVGLSSGAYSALRCAFLRPDRFGLCAGFSPGGLLIDEYLDALREQNPVTMDDPHLRSIFGPDLTYEDDDVLLRIAERFRAADEGPHLYLAMGIEDDLRPVSDGFVARLTKSSALDVVYETWHGGHGWYFWDEALKRFLKRYYPQGTA